MVPHYSETSSPHTFNGPLYCYFLDSPHSLLSSSLAESPPEQYIHHCLLAFYHAVSCVRENNSLGILLLKDGLDPEDMCIINTREEHPCLPSHFYALKEE
jgi:hypothetical protein